jgi:hypothetical protein
MLSMARSSSLEGDIVADDQVPLVRKRERRDCSISLCNSENVVIILIVSSPSIYFVLELTSQSLTEL